MSKKSFAVFTIVKNEKFFIKLWYNYYSQYFESDDIYILNHDSIDGSLNDINANIINIHNEFLFDHVWLREQVKSFQVKLLEQYDIVVFSEVDEFIVPINCSLKEYLINFKDDYVTCTGYNLCHSDINYDSTKKVLDQKDRFVKDNRWSNKTLISRIPLEWNNGFHNMHNMANKEDSNLLMLHLHYFDYNVFIERAKHRLQFKDKFSSDHEGIQNKYLDINKYCSDFESKQTNDYVNLNIQKVF